MPLLFGSTPPTLDATATRKGKLRLAGDLGGTALSPTVLKINGVTVSGTPAAGQGIIASSPTAAAWGDLPTLNNFSLDGGASNTSYVGVPKMDLGGSI